MQDRAQEISALEARCAELDADVLRRAQELPHADRAAAQRALVLPPAMAAALPGELAAQYGMTGAELDLSLIHI